MTASDDPLALDNQLCFAVYSTAHAFNRLYRQQLAALGLTYPQYLVLLVLWENAPVPVKAIGERLMLDSGTLTPLLKRMETMGLIRRERATRDERQVLVRPSAAGLALKEKAKALPPAVACASGLDRETLGRMAEGLRLLRGQLLAATLPE
ncbi:MarR family transcriptional regulator [Rhabdaerophilum sp. SD176]|uniref:MarR family winged helix-turn-helix transcriptional regulator n=1 Tax=Rhabdaerophilum sp. SD176 TaxID=2983548 RepID=UPI0024DFFD93|nr:MarR family transcriptional regulator [Rhabdaerophilum sp. SD176]